jgi:hypothetical protein
MVRGNLDDIVKLADEDAFYWEQRLN